MARINSYNLYLQVKKELRNNYKGYPLEKIMALDIIFEVYQKPKFKYRSLGYFLRSLNMEKLKMNAPSETLFSIGEYDRKDYYEIWEYAQSQVKHYRTFDFYPLSYKIDLNLKNMIDAISFFRKSKLLSLTEKLKLAGKLTFYLNIIDQIEQIKPVAGKYCAFSSVHPLESILTSYFQKQGTLTYSLQHGLYFVFKNHILLDSIAYENFISDFHFCWGQYTKDEFTRYGINPKSLIVGGYPREVKRPSIPKKLDKTNLLVLLARNAFQSTNLSLIKILKQFSSENTVNVSLKLHPNLNREDYKKIANENNWNLIGQEITLNGIFKNNQFGLAIAVNTAAYYESYIYYLPCLRYNDGTFEDSINIMDDQFRSYEQLQHCISLIPFEEPDLLFQYYNEVEKRLQYAIGIKTNNYHKLNV